MISKLVAASRSFLRKIQCATPTSSMMEKSIRKQPRMYLSISVVYDVEGNEPASINLKATKVRMSVITKLILSPSLSISSRNVTHEVHVKRNKMKNMLMA